MVITTLKYHTLSILKEILTVRLLSFSTDIIIIIVKSLRYKSQKIRLCILSVDLDLAIKVQIAMNCPQIFLLRL